MGFWGNFGEFALVSVTSLHSMLSQLENVFFRFENIKLSSRVLSSVTPVHRTDAQHGCQIEFIKLKL